jgi:hypothetical protein
LFEEGTSGYWRGYWTILVLKAMGYIPTIDSFGMGFSSVFTCLHVNTEAVGSIFYVEDEFIRSAHLSRIRAFFMGWLADAIRS